MQEMIIYTRGGSSAGLGGGGPDSFCPLFHVRNSSILLLAVGDIVVWREAMVP